MIMMIFNVSEQLNEVDFDEIISDSNFTYMEERNVLLYRKEDKEIIETKYPSSVNYLSQYSHFSIEKLVAAELVPLIWKEGYEEILMEKTKEIEMNLNIQEHIFNSSNPDSDFTNWLHM